MSERDAILFANSAFYIAFSARDISAMGNVWAADRPVSCIHPGWATLYGREAVLKSWQSILRNPNAPNVKVHNEHVDVMGDTAIVTCVEDLNGRQFLAATNIFTRAGSAWRLVHHQAGPANIDPQSLEPAEDEAPRGPVN
jgi:ketosteroid isomerase-like protein